MNRNIMLTGFCILLSGCNFFRMNNSAPAYGEIPNIQIDGDPMACPNTVQPVCGYVPVQCFTMPCDPAPQTFANECLARKVGATNITEGACEQ